MSVKMWTASAMLAASALAWTAAGCAADNGSPRAANEFWAQQASRQLTVGNGNYTVPPADYQTAQPYAITGDEGARGTTADWTTHNHPRLTVGNAEIDVPAGR
jgi:hypothetical protein